MDIVKNMFVFVVFRVCRNTIGIFRTLNYFIRSHRTSESPIKSSHVRTLRREGLVCLPNFISQDFCSNAIQQFDVIVQASPNLVKFQTDVRLFKAEHFIEELKEFSESSVLSRLASSYVGFPMENSGCLMNQVPASSDSLGSGGSWHRDANFPQFKALLYLSDVEQPRDGAFQYIRKSHKARSVIGDWLIRKRKFFDSRWTADEVSSYFQKQSVISVLGAAGSLVLFDTCLLHRGAPNENTNMQPRYAATNYYYSKYGRIGIEY